MFSALPWSALAKPLEFPRGPWQLHVVGLRQCSQRPTAASPVVTEQVMGRNSRAVDTLARPFTMRGAGSSTELTRLLQPQP